MNSVSPPLVVLPSSAGGRRRKEMRALGSGHPRGRESLLSGEAARHGGGGEGAVLGYGARRHVRLLCHLGQDTLS